jgi:tetratricopeptide (TPR) repeat protein
MHFFLSGSLLFFSCVALCAGQEPEDIRDLAEGHPASVLLTREQGAMLRVDRKGSEAEEIFLDVAVPDISYGIATSDGTEILSGRLATFGWVVIPVSAAAWPEVQIRLQTESGAEGLPGVRVRAEMVSIPPQTLEAHRAAAGCFNTAQRLHRSLRAGDLRQAIGQFEQAAQAWARAGDLYGGALALGGKGESAIELSRYGDARRTLHRALGLAGKNAYLSGWLMHLVARALFDPYDGKHAQTYAEEELRFGQEIDDPALIALARTDLAGVAFWLRDSKMSEIADQAHSEAIAAGVPETLALERRWKGWIDEYYERGVGGMSELSEAETYFQRAGDWRNALDGVLRLLKPKA